MGLLQEYNLQDVCEQITDGKHGDCTNQADSGFYFLSAKDIVNGRIVYEKARQITKSDFLETHKRTRFEALDILFTNSGTIGRMAIAPNEERTHRTTFQKSVAILKPRKSLVNPRFLYYLLLGENNRLAEFASGTAQKNLLLKDLRNFRVSIPDRRIQGRITAILSAYDDLIENNTRRIKILEQMAQSLYREWFVHLRFPGHEKIKFVDSPLGNIPNQWEIKKLGEIADINACSIKRGNGPKEIEYIDISSVVVGRIENIERYALADAPGRARRIVKHGDIIWSCVRPNRKSYALVLKPEPNLIVSTGFAVVSAKHAPYTYLYQALTTEEFVGYLTNRARGAAYPAVTSEDFKDARLLLPPDELLDRFDLTVSSHFELINELHRENANLCHTRDLLLPGLLSAQIAV